jgi:hypothetical protein
LTSRKVETKSRALIFLLGGILRTKAHAIEWNPLRAKMLGASVLEALSYSYVTQYLREEGEFWNEAFNEEDKYVRPAADYKSL